jgi:hypothetical protein
MTTCRIESAEPPCFIIQLEHDHTIRCVNTFNEKMVKDLPGYKTNGAIQYNPDITSYDDDLLTSEYTLKTECMNGESQVTVNMAITDAGWGPYGCQRLRLLKVQISDREPKLTTLYTSSARYPNTRNREAEVDKFRNAAQETIDSILQG